MRRFARQCRVVYVNSLGVKAPAISEGRMFLQRVLRKCRSVARCYRDGGEGFAVLSPMYIPIVNGLIGRGVTLSLRLQLIALLRLLNMRRPLIWIACPTAARVLRELPRAAAVYQLSDCYAALYGGTASLADEWESTLARQAELVICSSARLLERSKRLYGVGEYVDHGVDFKLFDSACQHPRTPPELQDVERPIVGFFGNMDGNTVDRTLLERVICLRPLYRFVLLGSMSADFEGLKRHSNVVAIPQKAYHKVPYYGAMFDVCVMPWLQNEWIEHCNPVKLKEYHALGKPVVSTPFPELLRNGSFCEVAVGAEAFAAAIDRALHEDNPARREQRRAWAAQHTWDAKFDRVIELLRDRGIERHGHDADTCSD